MNSFTEIDSTGVLIFPLQMGQNPREDGNYIWVRPEKMFLEEIPERPDNITGQKHRFEVAQELTIDYTKK